MKKNILEKEKTLNERLSKQLFEHCEKLRLSKVEAAELVCKSYDTYHRWESTGKGLTDIYDILDVFKKFKFTTIEIIKTLGLPPLSLEEVQELFSEEAIQGAMKNEGVCSYMRKNCTGMSDTIIESLLDILFMERLKRHQCEEWPCTA